MGILFESSIGESLAKALSSTTLWTNICKTIVFIFLGFILTKKKKLPENTGPVLTKFIMTVSLPCLAFCSFMTDFTVTAGKDALVNFILGFVLYIMFMFLAKLIFCWVKEDDKRLVLSVLFAFGSTTFFGYPIVSSVYGGTTGNDFNIMNIAYRCFLYSYAYLAISGKKISFGKKSADKEGAEQIEQTPANDTQSFGKIMKQVFLNPIIIATLAGLLLWVLQAIPGVNFVPKDWLTTGTSETKVALWRFDVTLPWLYNTANTLGGLASTVILFAIGCTLGKTSLKEAAQDKYAWIYSVLKVFGAPLIVTGLLFAIEGIAKACGGSLISAETFHSCIFTWMVPPATVAVGYCVNFNKEKEMASHISLISTLVAVVGIVVWILLISVVDATGFFVSSVAA